MNNRRMFLSSLFGLVVGGTVTAVSPKGPKAQPIQSEPIQSANITIHVSDDRIIRVIERNIMNNGRIREAIIKHTS